jgi:hypothetical protein
MNMPSISVDRAFVDERPAIAVKIQGAEYEINIVLTDDDIAILDRDLPTVPNDRSLTAGTCFDAPVHWSKDSSDHLCIMVGQDDVTWDVGVTLPIDLFGQMLQSIRAVAIR